MNSRSFWSAILAAILAQALLVVPLAFADPLTHEQGDAILEELRQIHKLLERQQPPAQAAAPQVVQATNGKVNIDGALSIGKSNAPLTMVIFTDYQCPFCQRYERQTFDEIKKNWIDTGKLHYVVRDMPLDFHENALKASQSTYCANEQGKFWEMREKLIANADKLQRDKLVEYAGQAGLDVSRFNACLDSDRYLDKIRASVTEANSQHVSGTPSFIIGKSNGSTVDGALVVGAVPYEVFNGKLNEMMPR